MSAEIKIKTNIQNSTLNSSFNALSKNDMIRTLINAGCTLIACFVFVEKGCKGFLFNIDSSNYVNSRLGKAPNGGGGW